MEDREQQRLKFQAIFVLILVLAISAIFGAMIWPFFEALLLAAIASAMLQPVYKWLKKLFRGRSVLASITTIIFLIVIIIGPLAAFLGIVVEQAVEVSQTAIPWVQKNLGHDGDLLLVEKWITKTFPSLENMMPSRSELLHGIGELAQKAGGLLVTSFTKMTTGTTAFFLSLFVMLYSMFYFLIDGRAILDRILSYSPLSEADSKHLVDQFYSVTRATLKSSLTIGALQGALGGIAFAVAGISGAAFWATIMAILSIIPGIGSMVVWIPAVIYLFIQGEPLSATLLAAWCAGVVGTVDNFLRPRLVGKDTQLPDILTLLGTFGGIILFGTIGILVGPIICSLFLTVWVIYGTTFKEYLPRYGNEDPEGESKNPPAT